MPDSDTDEPTPLTPEEAFAVLGNEIRVDILRALWEAGEPLAYSELQERIGVCDSGRFNYHLRKLVGVDRRGRVRSRYAHSRRANP